MSRSLNFWLHIYSLSKRVTRVMSKFLALQNVYIKKKPLQSSHSIRYVFFLNRAKKSRRNPWPTLLRNGFLLKLILMSWIRYHFLIFVSYLLFFQSVRYFHFLDLNLFWVSFGRKNMEFADFFPQFVMHYRIHWISFQIYWFPYEIFYHIY